tara:strand:+ start:8320 stop:8697 length:378 start_codon:yes stop_codon:yes gene_type:complete
MDDEEELSIEQFQNYTENVSKKIYIFKFGAEWCKPCKVVKPWINEWLNKMPNNVLFFDLDVDTSMDIYMKLKSKKMINGIPAILFYYGDVKRENWYIPDLMLSGANKENLDKLFEKCLTKAKSMV